MAPWATAAVILWPPSLSVERTETSVVGVRQSSPTSCPMSWSFMLSAALGGRKSLDHRRPDLLHGAATNHRVRREGSELLIHGQDGKIQRKDSHGKDPFPPRG